MGREPDSAAVTRAIETVAAEIIRPRLGTMTAADIDEKSGPADVVTAIDVAAEHALRDALAAIDPDAVLVGEEGVAADPSRLAALNGPRACWLVDPIDGTANFAVGLPLVAVMVAHVVGGEARMAWIHDVMRNVTIAAAQGGGAFLGGQRLRTVAPRTAAHMAGIVSLRSGSRARAARIVARLPQIGLTLGLRSAGLEYMALAEGRVHYAQYNRLLPWDHAPGALIVTEAGGIVRRIDGTRYRACDDAGTGAPLVSAADEQTWRWFVDDVIGG